MKFDEERKKISNYFSYKYQAETSHLCYPNIQIPELGAFGHVLSIAGFSFFPKC